MNRNASETQGQKLSESHQDDNLGTDLRSPDSHVCRNDSLYPRSQYRCDACGTVHGTRAYNGAVNWQCPNELYSGTADAHRPAHQTYIGFACVVCNRLIKVDSPEFRAIYPTYRTPPAPSNKAQQSSSTHGTLTGKGGV